MLITQSYSPSSPLTHCSSSHSHLLKSLWFLLIYIFMISICIYVYTYLQKYIVLFCLFKNNYIIDVILAYMCLSHVQVAFFFFFYLLCVALFVSICDYCPWDFPGNSTGVDCHFLLRGSSQPRDQTQVSCIVDRCFTVWATRDQTWVLSSERAESLPLDCQEIPSSCFSTLSIR